MTDGAYSINVRVRGPSGEGTVSLPVVSSNQTVAVGGWLDGVLMAFDVVDVQRGRCH